MASGDERMNGCKWCSCIARVRSPSNEEAANAPPDFGDSTFEQHYQLLLRMGVDEKKARRQTLKRQAEKRARQIANEGGGASSSRTNGCKWCSCIAIPRSPRQEVPRENLSGHAPHDFDSIILDPHYRQYLRLGLNEKKAREEALKLKVFKDRIYEKREAEKKAREEAEKKAVEEPVIDLEEELDKMKKAREEWEERYRKMVARANQGSSKTKPSASEEPGGRKCSCCGADDRLLNTWSGCGHLICDDCMGSHLPQVMARTLWEVKCKVEKCQFTMTAEECRVFLPGHEDLIDAWIAKIPEAVRNPNPPPAVESRVENQPHDADEDADEEADFDRAVQLSLEPHSPGANQGEGASSSNAKPGGGPECGRCGSDEGRIHTWSRCGHLICDKCMVDHLEYMIEYKVWNVRCRVKGCPETMTAEECRVFLPDNQQDLINAWIASIPEASRAN